MGNIPQNKFFTQQRIAQLETEMADLRKLVEAIELKEGPPGQPGSTGQAGRDGKSVVGPQGIPGRDSVIPGPPGQSIKGDRGERGPAGPDSAEVLAAVRQELSDLKDFLVEAQTLYEMILKGHQTTLANRRKVYLKLAANYTAKGLPVPKVIADFLAGEN